MLHHITHSTFGLTCKTVLKTDFFTIEFVSRYVSGAYVDVTAVLQKNWPHPKYIIAFILLVAFFCIGESVCKMVFHFKLAGHTVTKNFEIMHLASIAMYYVQSTVLYVCISF